MPQCTMARPDELTAMEILSVYAAVWSDTQKMLDAARGEDWDNLIGLEQGRRPQVEKMLQMDSGNVENPEFLTRKSELIRSIITADEEIKLLTRKWMDKLGETLNIIGVDKRLKQAYGTSDRG